jgi:hypothetical protein
MNEQSYCHVMHRNMNLESCQNTSTSTAILDCLAICLVYIGHVNFRNFKNSIISPDDVCTVCVNLKINRDYFSKQR